MENKTKPILVLLSKGSKIKDNVLHCPAGIRVDGEAEINIRSDGDVIIGPSGSVQGHINALNLEVYGKVKGNVTCKNKAKISSIGTIRGDINTKFFEIEKNGTFEGKLMMQK